MKDFKVKLLEGHTATKDQNVNGYLGDNTGSNPLPYIYGRGQAIKKARLFGGKIDEIKDAINIEELRVAKITENSLVYGIEKLLSKRTAEFIDTGDMGERIYTADVFANIYNEMEHPLAAKTAEQLNLLISNLWAFEYVLISKT